MTVERYRDGSVNPPFSSGPPDPSVAAPLVPQQRRLALPPAGSAPADLPVPVPVPVPVPYPSSGFGDPARRPGPAGYGGRPGPDEVDAAGGPAMNSEPAFGSPGPYGSGEQFGADPVAGAPADIGHIGQGDAAADEPDREDPDDPETPGQGGLPPAAGPTAPSPRHKPWPSPRQQIATAIMVLCTLITLFLLGHRYLPGAMGVVPLIESWLPWLAIPIGVLLLSALAVHTPRALIAAGVAAAVWLAGYGPALLPRGGGLPAQLRVFSVDVNGQPGELSRAGSLALAQNADLIVLQDVYGNLSDSSAAAKLNAKYPAPANHVTQYEFGVWSKYRIVSSTPIDLGTTTADTVDGDQALVADGTTQQVFGALRITVATPEGDLVAYVVHIPQPVLNDNGFAVARNAAVKRLAAVVSADHAPKLIVVGDVNIAATDREFSVIQQDLGLTSAQSAAGQGFGFTWPAEFPAVRLDDLLTRNGVTAVRSVVLKSIGTGKTHLPIEVDLNL